MKFVWSKQYQTRTFPKQFPETQSRPVRLHQKEACTIHLQNITQSVSQNNVFLNIQEYVWIKYRGGIYHKIMQTLTNSNTRKFKILFHYWQLDFSAPLF